MRKRNKFEPLKNYEVSTTEPGPSTSFYFDEVNYFDNQPSENQANIRDIIDLTSLYQTSLSLDD